MTSRSGSSTRPASCRWLWPALAEQQNHAPTLGGVIRLNCSSVESTLDSLAAPAGVPASEVRAALLAFEEPQDWGPIDVREELPQQLFGSLTGTAERLRFDECIYFHGTRTADPER